VVKAELGTKRTCPSCAAKFYDLLKNPIQCPKCGTSFIAAAILPSKADVPGLAAVPQPKPMRVTEEAEKQDTGEVELVSLEEVEEDNKDDDETAGIEDVDLGEDAGGAAEDDDTFLVEEEEEGGAVTGLIEGGGKEEEEP
jgi:uncharacterized protein (TIGR02300 family)